MSSVEVLNSFGVVFLKNDIRVCENLNLVGETLTEGDVEAKKKDIFLLQIIFNGST